MNELVTECDKQYTPTGRLNPTAQNLLDFVTPNYIKLNDEIREFSFIFKILVFIRDLFFY